MASRIFVLTGGIGCGKSLIGQAFADLGITVVDADVIAHTLTTSGGEAMPALKTALGAQAINPDGSLNRPWVRGQAFGQPAIREQLEAILHPMIQEKARAALRAASGPYVIYAVPLWLEKYGDRSNRHNTGPHSLPGFEPEAVIAVDCPEDLQIARVQERSGLTADEVRAIMATQVSRSERLRAADHLITNDQSIASAVSQVQLLHKKLIAS